MQVLHLGLKWIPNQKQLYTTLTRPKHTLTAIQSTTTVATTTFTWWSYTPRGLAKALRMFVVRWTSRSISKEEIPSRTSWWPPNPGDNITQKSGVFYKYKCDQMNCKEEYIEESSRTFGERLNEHLRTTSFIYDHGNTSGHCICVNNFSTVGQEVHNIMRTIIRVNDPSLNRNIGKFLLLCIWDEALLNTTTFHPK